MKRQLGMVLLLSLVSAGSAYAGAGDRLDMSRSRNEARYSRVGNEQTDTIVTPPTTKTVIVPDTSAATMKALRPGEPIPTKKKVVVVPGSVKKVTRPAPARINPY